MKSGKQRIRKHRVAVLVKLRALLKRICSVELPGLPFRRRNASHRASFAGLTAPSGIPDQ